eukprot:Rmarinus@m.9369
MRMLVGIRRLSTASSRPKHRLIFFDTESTGMVVSRERIFDLAAHDLKGNRTFSQLMNPERYLDSKIQRLTGIKPEDILRPDIPKLREGLGMFLDFLEDCRDQDETLILLAHNCKSFDSRLLTYNLMESGLSLPPRLFFADTLEMARRMVFPEPPNYKLQTLARVYGITSEQVHRAQADTFMLVDVFRKMIHPRLPEEIDLRYFCFKFDMEARTTQKVFVRGLNQTPTIRQPTRFLEHYLDDEHPRHVSQINVYCEGKDVTAFGRDAEILRTKLDADLCKCLVPQRRDENVTADDESKSRTREFIPMARMARQKLQADVWKLLDDGFMIAFHELKARAKTSNNDDVAEVTVARLETPAMRLSGDDVLMERYGGCFVAAACKSQDEDFALTFADISSGEFRTVMLPSVAELEAEITRVSPRELILPDGFYLPNISEHSRSLEGGSVRNPNGLVTVHVPSHYFDDGLGIRIGVTRGTDVDDYSCGSLRAAAAIVHYVKRALEDELRGSGEITPAKLAGTEGRTVRRVLDNKKKRHPSGPTSEDEWEERAVQGVLSRLGVLRANSVHDYMMLEETTLRDLQVTHSPMGRAATLFGILDRTQNAAGKRELTSWLRRPLMDVHEISLRQSAVTELVGLPEVRSGIQEGIRALGDIPRLLSRVVNSHRLVRVSDLLRLGHSLVSLDQLSARARPCNAELLSPVRQNYDNLVSLGQSIVDRIDPDSLGGLKEDVWTFDLNHVVKRGVCADLDALRLKRSKLATQLENLEKELADQILPKGNSRKLQQFGGVFRPIRIKFVGGEHVIFIRRSIKLTPDMIAALGLKYTSVPVSSAHSVPYTSDRLADLNDSIFSIAYEAWSREFEIIKSLFEDVERQAIAIREAGEGCAVADVLCSLADVAHRRGWVQPLVTKGHELCVLHGKHPVLEDSKDCTPNSVSLGRVPTGFSYDDTCRPENIQWKSKSREKPVHGLVVTGPNAGGKSCYLKQIGVLQILAQVGSYVPAEYMRTGVVDRVCTRIGAYDDTATGRSTFVVEMTELSAILSSLTDRSLILLDELGRGTSSRDGAALAQATFEKISAHPTKVVFATHFHNIPADVTKENVRNLCMQYEKKDDTIVFHHRAIPGVSELSYGIEVAQMCGIPPKVIDVARHLFQESPNG